MTSKSPNLIVRQPFSGGLRHRDDFMAVLPQGACQTQTHVFIEEDPHPATAFSVHRKAAYSRQASTSALSMRGNSSRTASTLSPAAARVDAALLKAGGNVVSLTETINGLFGALIVAEPYGIVVNKEMDDFPTVPGQVPARALGVPMAARPAVVGGRQST